MEYTKEEINRDRKHYLKEQIQNAKDLIKITQGTEICWEVSCNYEKSETNVLDSFRTEKECQEMIEDWGKTKNVELFYRPIVIDNDSGETVTFQNLHYYKKDSFFVKSLNKYLYATN